MLRTRSGASRRWWWWCGWWRWWRQLLFKLTTSILPSGKTLISRSTAANLHHMNYTFNDDTDIHDNVIRKLQCERSQFARKVWPNILLRIMSFYLLYHLHEIFKQLLMVCLTSPPIGYHGCCQVAQNVRTHCLYCVQVPEQRISQNTHLYTAVQCLLVHCMHGHTILSFIYIWMHQRSHQL